MPTEAVEAINLLIGSSCKTAIREWFELKERIRTGGQVAHSDFWHEAIYQAEQKLRACIEPKPDFSVKTGYEIK